jgi:hypothetical protein
MRASRFAEALAGLTASHEFIPLRTPNKNAHIESFFFDLRPALAAAILLGLAGGLPLDAGVHGLLQRGANIRQPRYES